MSPDYVVACPEFNARFLTRVRELGLDAADAAQIKPGFSPLEYRWAALAVRKKSKAKPDASDVTVSLEREIRIEDAAVALPSDPGLYLFTGPELPLFVNHADDLRSQLGHHLELAGTALIPEWLLGQSGPVSRLSYVALPSIRPDRLREYRITSIARFRPWLNLIDLEGAA
jgi:hypothetical protein